MKRTYTNCKWNETNDSRSTCARDQQPRDTRDECGTNYARSTTNGSSVQCVNCCPVIWLPCGNTLTNAMQCGTYREAGNVGKAWYSKARLDSTSTVKRQAYRRLTDGRTVRQTKQTFDLCISSAVVSNRIISSREIMKPLISLFFSFP